MPGAEKAGLPKDRKGRTLRLPYEVLLVNTAAQGVATSLTMALLHPAAWYARLHMGADGNMRYRTVCDGFRPDGLERIEVGIDGNDQ